MAAIPRLQAPPQPVDIAQRRHASPKHLSPLALRRRDDSSPATSLSDKDLILLLSETVKSANSMAAADSPVKSPMRFPGTPLRPALSPEVTQLLDTYGPREPAFHLFGELPAELRMQIWEDCLLPCSRHLVFRVDPLHRSSHCQITTSSGNGGGGGCHSGARTCVLSQVCRESRRVALQHGHYRRLQSLPTRPFGWLDYVNDDVQVSPDVAVRLGRGEKILGDEDPVPDILRKARNIVLMPQTNLRTLPGRRRRADSEPRVDNKDTTTWLTDTLPRVIPAARELTFIVDRSAVLMDRAVDDDRDFVLIDLADLLDESTEVEGRGLRPTEARIVKHMVSEHPTHLRDAVLGAEGGFPADLPKLRELQSLLRLQWLQAKFDSTPLSGVERGDVFLADEEDEFGIYAGRDKDPDPWRLVNKHHPWVKKEMARIPNIRLVRQFRIEQMLPHPPYTANQHLCGVRRCVVA